MRLPDTRKDEMHHELIGFRQDGAMRCFWFRRVEFGTEPVLVSVLADTSLARTFKLTLQELPSLCSRLLNANAGVATGPLVLSESEMSVRAGENAAAAAQLDELRLLRSRRSSLSKVGRPGGQGAVSLPS